MRMRWKLFIRRKKKSRSISGNPFGWEFWKGQGLPWELPQYWRLSGLCLVQPCGRNGEEGIGK